MQSIMKHHEEKYGPSVSEDSRMFVHEDGTTIVYTHGGEFFQVQEPPRGDNLTDTVNRLLAQREYFAVKERIEVKKFDAFKKDCQDQISYQERFGISSVPGPPANAVQQLEAGKERVLELRERIAEINAQIDEITGSGKDPETAFAQQQAASRQEAIAATRAVQEQLRTISV